MVNLTDSFTKLYGRRPTEVEIATMMQMKAEQDARKNGMIKPKQDTAEMSKRSREQFKKPKREPRPGRPESNRYRWPYRASQRTIQINKMLLDNITVERMAYYLNVSDACIITEIQKWGLPQKENKDGNVA